jgi:hypothetical protein
VASVWYKPHKMEKLCLSSPRHSSVPVSPSTTTQSPWLKPSYLQCCESYEGHKPMSSAFSHTRPRSDTVTCDPSHHVSKIKVLLIYLLTCLLTPCSVVLLEKLTDFQLVKKFPEFYGNRMFITVFTSARHMSLS